MRKKKLCYKINPSMLIIYVGTTVCAHLRWDTKDLVMKDRTYQNSYPPGSKCEALRLGVHLILLYFIRILFWVRRLFFYFVDVDVGVDVDVDVDGGLFLSLNLLIIIWYIVYV